MKSLLAVPFTALLLLAPLSADNSEIVHAQPNQSTPAAPPKAEIIMPNGEELTWAQAIERMRLDSDRISEQRRQENLQKQKQEVRTQLQDPHIDGEKFNRVLAMWRSAKPTADETITLLQPFLEKIAQDRREALIQVYSMHTIAAHRAEAKTMAPLLVELLDKSTESEVRREAATTLQAVAPGDAATVAALMRALEKNSQTHHFARILGEIGEPARAAAPVLIRALDAGTDDSRYEAYRALGKISSEYAKLPLEQQIERLQHLGKLPPAQTSASFLAVQAAGRNAAAAIPILVRLIKARPADYLLRTAITTLGEVGPGSNREATQTLVDYLSEYVSDHDFGSSINNAVGAMKFGPADVAAVEPLARMMRDPRLRMRLIAAQSLAAIGPAAAPATIALSSALREANSKTNRDVVSAYIKALTRIGRRAVAAADTILFLLGRQSPLFERDEKFTAMERRANLFNALARTGVPDESRNVAVARVLEGLASGEGLVFVGAARAVAVLGDEAHRAVPLLLNALEGTMKYVPVGDTGDRLFWAYVPSTTPRIEAIQALDRMGAAAAPALPTLKRLAQKEVEPNRWNDLHEEEHARKALEQIETTIRIQQMRAEIARLEAQSVPSKGTARTVVEKMFGAGTPSFAGKVPPKAGVPDNSPLRAYKFAEIGTLIVSYDPQWKVRWAHYVDPFSTKGRPFGVPFSLEVERREVEPRLKQMQRIAEEYNKRFGKQAGATQ